MASDVTRGNDLVRYSSVNVRLAEDELHTVETEFVLLNQSVKQQRESAFGNSGEVGPWEAVGGVCL
jgi:hypothetical protein